MTAFIELKYKICAYNTEKQKKNKYNRLSIKK